MNHPGLFLAGKLGKTSLGQDYLVRRSRSPRYEVGDRARRLVCRSPRRRFNAGVNYSPLGCLFSYSVTEAMSISGSRLSANSSSRGVQVRDRIRIERGAGLARLLALSIVRKIVELGKRDTRKCQPDNHGTCYLVVSSRTIDGEGHSTRYCCSLRFPLRPYRPLKAESSA